MSQQDKQGPYVYQPDPPRPDGRIYAIGGMPLRMVCKGLTRVEADAICAALTQATTEPSTGAERR